MSELTHLDDDGAARMVDVGAKQVTERSATAAGFLRASASTIATISEGNTPKGDVLGTARIAGIMAAKKTADLIPLCHPLPLDSVTIDFAFHEESIAVTATARLSGKTGVEMEALTAASIALLTLYDMAKALEKGMVIEQVRLLSKTGGKSGDWHASEAR
ncbi:cyclic pyranopterin monophosphate synthase MoaC [Aurantiacibacter sp. MUD61]|uniref:cyclic pyranopterin monophosphate synthase MoaC n=1 Tax=Aurantiacibacter sp. MUD61 TaxID=3009083 RepID=UPI0022F0B193|nr:cyclic pyranopterin monophosphate synthase MoaC [Aurantiacibacter sp. MUD61]